jgi:hypothetical protein
MRHTASTFALKSILMEAGTAPPRRLGSHIASNSVASSPNSSPTGSRLHHSSTIYRESMTAMALIVHRKSKPVMDRSPSCSFRGKGTELLGFSVLILACAGYSMARTVHRLRTKLSSGDATVRRHCRTWALRTWAVQWEGWYQ